ncbi:MULTISPECIES: DUF4349 domain-containing protein [Chryseobacterium]|uniref:DUF4349 domain-containing protein n=1 Tax=Chryseobacterium TaxID=59732 RepID=UPI00195A41FC|nr:MULTISPECIES: DUF4349 domain-containing protein [Chryseobacterium]MBM7419612.1 hypothetical protein [Chryseobacterium sp. JUb44]MDH6209543.1 hypothetical protein [Chryseobacterium sp. BIGb0186]WSO08305.1 DUF4349 domain-containing protein [Chryseobacterium scophthalmum]
MKKLFIPLFLLILINCKKSDNQQEIKSDLVEIISEDKAMDMNAPPAQEIQVDAMVSAKAVNTEPKYSPSQSNNVIVKKVIKNGDLDIQVGDIRKAHQQVNEIVKSNNAYIQTERFNNTDIDEKQFFTIRVPHKNFDGLINSFSNGIGSVLSKNIASDDVTEEYTDVSIKLANKKIYLEKYRDMLRSAKTTKDMLEIQENIRELEDEIDIAEGRLRFIDDRVNYSTLNLMLYKEKVRSSATSKIGFGNSFGDSFTEGWNSFVAFFLGIISLWPFFLLIPVIILVWKKWRNRKKKE